jgi:hypothetical protein
MLSVVMMESSSWSWPEWVTAADKRGVYRIKRANPNWTHEECLDERRRRLEQRGETPIQDDTAEDDTAEDDTAEDDTAEDDTAEDDTAEDDTSTEWDNEWAEPAGAVDRIPSRDTSPVPPSAYHRDDGAVTWELPKSSLSLSPERRTDRSSDNLQPSTPVLSRDSSPTVTVKVSELNDTSDFLLEDDPTRDRRSGSSGTTIISREPSPALVNVTSDTKADIASAILSSQISNLVANATRSLETELRDTHLLLNDSRRSEQDLRGKIDALSNEIERLKMHCQGIWDKYVQANDSLSDTSARLERQENVIIQLNSQLESVTNELSESQSKLANMSHANDLAEAGLSIPGTSSVTAEMITFWQKVAAKAGLDPQSLNELSIQIIEVTSNLILTEVAHKASLGAFDTHSATTSPATTSPATTSPATTSPATTSPATTSPATTSPATTSPATPTHTLGDALRTRSPSRGRDGHGYRPGYRSYPSDYGRPSAPNNPPSDSDYL